jgi:hypothetical protein
MNMMMKNKEDGMKQNRNSNIYPREVEFWPRVYLFGHYDSRGGGSLVIANNIVEALKIYNRELFSVDDCELDTLLAEDLMMATAELAVWDRPLPKRNCDIYKGYAPYYNLMVSQDQSLDEDTRQYYRDIYDKAPEDWKDCEGYILLSNQDTNSIILTTAEGIILQEGEIPNLQEDDLKQWIDDNGLAICNDMVYYPDQIPEGYSVQDPSEDSFGLYLIWSPTIKKSPPAEIPFDRLLRYRSRLTIDFYSDDPQYIIDMSRDVDSVCVAPVVTMDGVGAKFTFTAYMSEPEEISKKEREDLIAGN